MELVNGDRRLTNADEFPQYITPFPTAGTLLLSNPASAFLSPDVNHPPQKLRPIRGNGGRSPMFSLRDDPPLLFQQRTEVGGVLDDGGLGNLGLLSNMVAGDMAVNGGGGGGCGERVVVNDSVKFWSNWVDPNCEGGVSFDAESSSSSDGDDCGDSFKAVKESASRKRKRKRKKKLEDLLENLVTRMMEKQERMHQQLIEMIEKRERERIIREEAWKKQEIERLRRDEEARAQETARNLSLISFIQNVMGHEMEVPQPLTPISPPETSGDKDGSNLPTQTDFKCNSSDRRWPEAEVKALIMLRSTVEKKFQLIGSKCLNIWDEVSAKMHNMGYDRSAKKCKRNGKT
ncbi:hypothetical protein K2173_011052 [Erythroxylum novogranatense]|uniref:Myb/SANT-like DNA-binding domain-containing protein n=1 Tax=Erythroxylum novogranatense TaxID=1862640 RepID=A0AAV8T0C9_9ROSI|nr:hypothetical protein K2173_011052 [Erythroxylum novogranatense]